jgi:TRAP-type C4-dicarboxylate transport system permease small subunit
MAEPKLAESWVERASSVACELVLLGMVLLISAEVVARLFHVSLEIVDEIGGYLLSALTFLSLSVALVGGAYHQVDYFQHRMSVRARAITGIAFLLLSLVFALVLEWQLWRLVTRSYASNVTAPTVLGTPLWIPQSVMLIGTTVLIYSLVRMLAARARDLARREPGHA